jgi:hypothetical protein
MIRKRIIRNTFWFFIYTADMKKLNDIPTMNDRKSIKPKNSILVTAIPDIGAESSRPQVKGIIVTKI